LLCAENVGGNGAELSVVGADRPVMKFGDDFGARTLNDCDPSEQRRTKRQRQDRFVRRRNCCSIRRGKSVEARNDEINLTTAIGQFPFGGESGIFSGMTQDLPPIAVHPTGEQSTVALGGAAAAPQPLVVDSFAGSVRVEWDHATAFTPLGQLPFFIDFQ
jgi:hypothetical protein